MSATHTIRPIPEEEVEERLSPAIVLPSGPLPLTIYPARPLTDEELLEFCAENDGLEIESDADGSITVMTPARFKTNRFNQLLAVRLAVWAEQTGHGVVCGPDLGIRFADLVLRAPDAAWLSEKQVNVAEEQESTDPGFLHFCPEFVAELRSHTDRASQIEAKMEFWMSRGAQLGWLIDPRRKLAMIYRAGQEPETLLQPGVVEGDGPIQGFRLEMAEFWK
jgi:Uma2 family endonuclease